MKWQLMRPRPRDVHVAVPFQICWHYSNGRECRLSCKFAHGKEELTLWTTQRQAGSYDQEDSYSGDFSVNVIIYVTTFSTPLKIQKPKTKGIMHRDVFGYLMKNSSFLHP